MTVLSTQLYMDALASVALSTGHFASVNAVDVGSTPQPGGLSAVLWPRRIRALPAGSGLNTTSASLIFTMRLFGSMNSDPMGQIDPAMISAADDIMNLLSGDFMLNGLISYIDLLGEHGDALGSDSGFLKLNESQTFRIVDITIPMVIHNVWTQEA